MRALIKMRELHKPISNSLVISAVILEENWRASLLYIEDEWTTFAQSFVLWI